MTNDKGVITRAIEALERCEYALGRAVCWKPPSSSQREIEQGALDDAKQSLADLKAMKDAVPDGLGENIDVLENTFDGQEKLRQCLQILERETR